MLERERDQKCKCSKKQHRTGWRFFVVCGSIECYGKLQSHHFTAVADSPCQQKNPKWNPIHSPTFPPATPCTLAVLIPIFCVWCKHRRQHFVRVHLTPAQTYTHSHTRHDTKRPHTTAHCRFNCMRCSNVFVSGYFANSIFFFFFFFFTPVLVCVSHHVSWVLNGHGISHRTEFLSQRIYVCSILCKRYFCGTYECVVFVSQYFWTFGCKCIPKAAITGATQRWWRWRCEVAFLCVAFVERYVRVFGYDFTSCCSAIAKFVGVELA